MIIDASVAVKWLIEESDSETALALLGTDDLAAPTLIHAEVGNAIYKSASSANLPTTRRWVRCSRSLPRLSAPSTKYR